MGSTNRMRLLGAAFIAILIVAGCGDDNPQAPKVVGSPPDALSGIWEITEESTADCPRVIPFKTWEAEFIDTICAEELDFSSLNAMTAWDMFLRYEGIIPGRWTEPDIQYCSGTINDSSIVVVCKARVSSTLEECDFDVYIYTSGAPDGDEWLVRRKVERIEAEDCGQRPGDTLTECHIYYSSLTRIGDAPEDCSGSNSVIGR